MNEKQNKFVNKERKSFTYLLISSLIFVEIAFLVFLIGFFPTGVSAGVGSPNVTVATNLTVGAVYPEILNVTNLGFTSVDLTPNATTNVTFLIHIRDYNGDGDIRNLTARFFDNGASSYAAADDNNTHYTNNNCTINRAYGDSFEANATCLFQVQYFANNATWNITAFVTDNSTRTDMKANITTVNTLLALRLPDRIDYGEVNSTEISDERIANVTNAGNVRINLSLSGYAKYVGDGNAMNCTLGYAENITVQYEKYNLTASNAGAINLSQFEHPTTSNYTNLTASATTKRFGLNYRQNDVEDNDATNSTYWRIYVPIGVAGTCSGNIVFGATIGSGT